MPLCKHYNAKSWCCKSFSAHLQQRLHSAHRKEAEDLSEDSMESGAPAQAWVPTTQEVESTSKRIDE